MMYPDRFVPGVQQLALVVWDKMVRALATAEREPESGTA
jgi:hypothetical protein